jgi:hypothetical protein
MSGRLAIVQARLGSARLPGKVLADLGGAPMLARVLERLRRCTTLDQIAVAIPDGPADDALVETRGARPGHGGRAGRPTTCSRGSCWRRGPAARRSSCGSRPTVRCS